MQKVKSNILELGCGKNKKYDGSTGVDVIEGLDADVVHDLNQFPYPFETSSFDLVVCEHVMEHLDDIVKTMEEIHRILAPKGVVHILSPHFSSADAYTDPTHKHFISTATFDYFSSESSFSELGYSQVRFKIIKKQVELYNRVWKPKVLTWWANRHLRFWEINLAFILPAKWAYFELQAVNS